LEQSRTLGAAEARMKTALLRLWLGVPWEAVSAAEHGPAETRPAPGGRGGRSNGAGASSGTDAAPGPNAQAAGHSDRSSVGGPTAHAPDVSFSGAAAPSIDSLVRTIARDLGTPLPTTPLVVAVAHGPEAARSVFAERIAALEADVFAAEFGEATVLVAAAHLLDDDASAVQRAARELPELVVGVSAAQTADAREAEAYRQARQAYGVGARAGRTVTVYGHTGASLLPFLGDDAVRGWAEELLAPLTAHDASARGDLVASVRAWLARHGQWDAAANDLGVHRHTLRYRMRRAEEILGRRLDDPDVRAELWLALRLVDPEGTGARSAGV
ncbi:MAG: helix-turn-helix domain-containing protein, partial [Streptomycetaceae bacterium]|nr:helix-turn-helix domain-containing protein [Streptomycetaceae bacterium]